MANPKIEFYRFKLNSKKGKNKTFRDFSIEELKADVSISNEDAFMVNFEYFMKKINLGHASNRKLKKTFTIIDDKKINPYSDLKPTFSKAKNIFSGVISGGPYDRDRINSSMSDKKESTKLGRDRSILSPYFIFVYLPSEHHEGFFAIHSNSNEEKITTVFRTYVIDLFSGIQFSKGQLSHYSPKSFQDDFKKDATIKEFTFETSLIEKIISSKPMKGVFDEYTIKITAVPKGKKKVPFSEAKSILTYLSKKVFRHDESRSTSLGDFSNKKFIATNSEKKKDKVFQWSTKDHEFIPTVYLKEYVKINDGVPDFEELKAFCLDLFESKIKLEIRKDLNVKRIK